MVKAMKHRTFVKDGCIDCGAKQDLYEKTLFVLEYSDNASGFTQRTAMRFCGTVKGLLCKNCLNDYITRSTKGLLVPAKVKESAKAALATNNYSEFIEQAMIAVFKEIIEQPNAGKSQLYAAWAQANAADHLVADTHIPADYVMFNYEQYENGGYVAGIAPDAIRYRLERPCRFKFAAYDAAAGQFRLANGEMLLDPKWLMSLEAQLRSVLDISGNR